MFMLMPWFRKNDGTASNYDCLLLRTLPEFYQKVDSSLYTLLIKTSCYVASLSDSAAILLHKKIKGIEI